MTQKKSRQDSAQTPLSEIDDKLSEGSKEELIADLRRIAEAEPERKITRNYYRIFGAYKDSAWNRHFGKFAEFKRAAKLTLTRHQLGSGHRRSAAFCDGEKWSNGFLLAHCDTQSKASIFEYIDIRDFAIIGGEYYTRKSSEFVTDL